MVSIHIRVTDDQARRLLAAARFVGPTTTVDELVVANALAHLDDRENREAEAKRTLRDGVRIYVREKRLDPIDRNLRLRYVGVE